MAPPKQSSFFEGSMNDRVSAVPPADFLGDTTTSPTGSADYERHFAMDWKPPELQCGRNNGADGGGLSGGLSNMPGSRTSFMSVRSGVSAFTTRTGAPPAKTPRGLLGKVREKLALHKSRSSWTVGAEGDEDEGGAGSSNDVDDKSSFLANFSIPPVFKLKRSESMDPTTLRVDQRGRTSDGHPTNEFGVFRTAAAGSGNKKGRPALPLRADSLGLPSTYDPSKRPSRDEITANYQTLLASGFFGNRAIQSTRFSPPGAILNRRNEQQQEPAPDAPPSLAQRLDKAEDEATSIPPSPLRQPPPVPSPSRDPPPPPPPPPPPAAVAAAAMDMGMEMEMEVEVEVEVEESEDSAGTSTPTAAVPASSTALFNPPPPAPTTMTSHGADRTMSPPPLPRQRQHEQTPTHKPAHSFSAIPYTATRPGIEPIQAQRPYRPPPVALARFSIDSSRPSRGTKRPFSSGAANESQTSFYTDRTSYDYDPMAMDGHGGIGVATTTLQASPEKVESGARKFVKRLKKSASKLSFRSQSSARQFGDRDEEDGEEGGGGAELRQPPSRTPMPSTARRSFSWRLGSGSKPGGGTSSANTFLPQHHDATSVSSFSSSSAGHDPIFGAGKAFSLNDAPSTNSSMDNFHPPPPPTSFSPVFAAAPTLGHGLPVIAASPASPPAAADRNRLKMRDIRTRRLRRKEESAGNTMGSPLAAAAAATGPPASPSKRPRRSGASIFMRALENTRTDGEEEETDESEPEMPEPMSADFPSAAPSEGMEGVEFSFHFPGRTRPLSGAAGAGAGGGGVGGGPLVVVPSVNRGLPSMSAALGNFGGRKSGSVRVVRAE